MAQQTYVQPMYETHWKTHTILVSLPNTIVRFSGNIIDPNSSVIQAMDIWNQAQIWFVQSYFPHNYPTYVFRLEVARPGQVPQVTVQYIGYLHDGWWAETSQYGTKISIVIAHSDQNTVLAAHELGHVLGLGDNSINGDLERTSNVFSPYPSTLNLYAVYMQAKCLCYTAADKVILTQIPYMQWNPNLVVVTEFPNPALILVVAIITGLLLTVKLRRAPTCNT